MHPKITEFVTGALTVIPPDLSWQISCDDGELNVYIRSRGNGWQPPPVNTKVHAILSHRNPDRYGKSVALEFMKGISDHAVQPRNKSEAPQSRSEGL